MSLASESRPVRLNSGDDVDLVSRALNRLASALRHAVRRGRRQQRPVHRQRARVAGLGRAGAERRREREGLRPQPRRHATPATPAPASSTRPRRPRTTPAPQAPGRSRRRSRRSRRAGPTGDLWLRPDVVAPGYNIVAPQAATGTRAGAERSQPRHARRPALRDGVGHVDGGAGGRRARSALLLQAYRARHGVATDRRVGHRRRCGAQPYALVRAALMNTAGADLYEARWILTQRSRATRSTAPASPGSAAAALLRPRLASFARLADGLDDALRGAQRRGRPVRRPARRGGREGRPRPRARRPARRGRHVLGGVGLGRRRRDRPARPAGHVAGRRRRGGREGLAEVRRPRRAGRAGKRQGALRVHRRQPVRRQRRDHGSVEARRARARSTCRPAATRR